MPSPSSAVASSSEGAEPPSSVPPDGQAPLLPQYAIDGNLATRWGSEFMIDPSWIYVDLGATVHVSEVDILWETACASAYDIDVSNDAMTWTILQKVAKTPVTTPKETPPTNWANADVEKISGVGRYLRINGTMRCDMLYGYSFWEMRVYGDTNTVCMP
jgi:hypothetical protein